MSPERTLIEAAGVADGVGTCSPPGNGGAVLIEVDGGVCRVLAVGDSRWVEAHPGARSAARRAMPGFVLIPAFVNAHTHLDLTDLGPSEFEAEEGFVGWLETIRGARGEAGADPRQNIERGCRLLRRGGVAGVGDILGRGPRGVDAGGIETLRASGLEGVSFLEVFGLGSRQGRARAMMAEALTEDSERPVGAVRLGLQPHAPYSAGLEVFREAAELGREHGVVLATHLGESMDERCFVRDGEGALRAMIERLGLWEDSCLSEIGHGRSVVEHLGAVLGGAHWLAVHVNDCSDSDLELLAQRGAHVVYCPRASAYFGHERCFGAHRYREMLGAGINVALGTDSIVCLPRDEADRFSTLDEMRFLHRRDGADARQLLAMGTVHGARALGLDEARYTLGAGAIAGLLAVDVSGTREDAAPEVRVLESAALPQWVWPPEVEA